MNLGHRPVLVVVAVLAAFAALALAGRKPLAAQSAERPWPTQAQRQGSLTFVPGTHSVDQAAVRNAIAQARPEAQRLIDIVDGAVTVSVGATGLNNAAGYTRPRPDGFAVVLDLAAVSSWLGERGVTRLVLHEFAHVIDIALVPEAMRQQLDAAIPPGYPCSAGDDGSCVGRSAREERFAESFAKWATGDIGVNLDIGYKVPPPASIESWGAPLAALD